MSENKPIQGMAAIVGAFSGLLAATASLLTIINGGPTIKVDPALANTIQESTTSKEPVVTDEVEKTPIQPESILVEETPVEKEPSYVTLNEDPNLTKQKIEDLEDEEIDKKEKKHHKKHREKYEEKEED